MEITLAVLGSSALAALITGMFNLYQNKQKAETELSKAMAQQNGVLREGLQWVLYDRIKYLCKGHIARGFIASNDLEDLERMHKVYHDGLGGNGFLDDLMGAVHELDIVPAIMYAREHDK